MKKLVCIIGAFSLFSMVNAQSFLGLHTSNYDALEGMRYNPALLTANNMKWQVNILGFDAFAGNDFLSLQGNIKDWKDFDQYEDVATNLNGEPKDLHVNLDIQGPSFTLRIKDKNAFGFSTRVRGIATVNDISESLANSLWLYDKDFLSWEEAITDAKATVGMNAFGEAGIAYSRAIIDKGGHSLHVGITGKMLFRGVTGYLKTDNFTYYHDTTANTVNMGSTMVEGVFDLPVGDGEKYNFGIAGFGFDAGIVYEYRKPGKTDYFIRVGGSLVDAGMIKYEASSSSRIFVSSGLDVPEDHFYDAINDEYITFDDLLDTLGTNTVPTGTYKASLPMALQVFGDIRIVPKFFVNVSGQININSQKKEHPSANVANTVTVTPRFEIKSFAVFSPITYNKYSGFDFGLGIRAGQFAIGTSNLLGSLLRKETKAFDFFMSFGFGKVRKPAAPETWEAPAEQQPKGE